jgi:hypothetical protein
MVAKAISVVVVVVAAAASSMVFAAPDFEQSFVACSPAMVSARCDQMMSWPYYLWGSV